MCNIVTVLTVFQISERMEKMVKSISHLFEQSFMHFGFGLKAGREEDRGTTALDYLYLCTQHNVFSITLSVNFHCHDYLIIRTDCNKIFCTSALLL